MRACPLREGTEGNKRYSSFVEPKRQNCQGAHENGGDHGILSTDLICQEPHQDPRDGIHAVRESDEQDSRILGIRQ